MNDKPLPPILRHKDHDAPSVFAPDGLLREARRLGPRPYFVLVERALRDEGTSYHYRPAEDYASADAGLLARLSGPIADCGPDVHRGATWTTDAPFRETVDVIERGSALGLAAIEMESAALYALAAARGLRPTRE